MFETAELGRKVSKSDYRKLVPELRVQLLEIQQQVRRAKIPVVIVLAGVDGAGKGETVNQLNEWMDPRWIQTHAYNEPSDEERERPPFWRYWRDLPSHGSIGLFLSAWYSAPILNWVHEEGDQADLDESLSQINTFEKMLVNDGVVVIKFWMHLSKKAQQRRLKQLEADPLLRWKVTERDWNNWRLYERFIEAAERTMQKSSTGRASWHIVEGQDECYRSLAVAAIVRDTLVRELEQRALSEQGVPEQDSSPSGLEAIAQTLSHQPTIVEQLDGSLTLLKPQYKKALKEQQARLSELFQRAREAGRGDSIILLYEGDDAAGKGGAIRRITAALDARSYRVIPIAAPTDEERDHHYLWRFWRHIPRKGRVTIYDRSWYGRVLVERVEQFAREEEWRRAYSEINDFEEHLVNSGTLLLKFWIHVDEAVQLERFKLREQTPHKAWKLTEEDWRNREKRPQYAAAVDDMIQRTSSTIAPWFLVEGNDKYYARIKVLKTVCDQLQAALERHE
jgi:polyphosphate:AMP phosphotransferase